MRQLTRVAAAVLLAGLWMEPAAASAAILPATTGNGPLVVVKSSCPRLITPSCPKGYRARCTWWVHGGPKGPSMFRCCGRMGCVPHLSNQQTKEPIKPPKPLPGARLK